MEVIYYNKPRTSFGSGGEGKIFKVNHHPVAIKVFYKNIERNLKKPERMYRELKVIKTLKHENIVRYIQDYEDDNEVGIVMEFCSKGNLSDYLFVNGVPTQNQSNNYMCQILNGVKYIHDLGWCHRDIKLENILVTKDKTLKLCDFGYARKCVDEPFFQICGTPQYVAPEIINKLPYWGKLSDAWSVGVSFYAIVTGKLPFVAKNKTKLFEQIANKNISFSKLNVHSVHKKIISGLLTKDSLYRFTITKSIKIISEYSNDVTT